MTSSSQSDLFDYTKNETDNDPVNESSEDRESISKDNFSSAVTPKMASGDNNDTEKSGQPQCSCYHEEKQNWKQALQELDLPTIECGHVVDYLCNNAGATITESSAKIYAFHIRLFVEYLHAEKLTVDDTTLRDILQYFNFRARQNLSESTLGIDRAAITNLYKHIALYRDETPNFEWVLIREEIDPSDFKTSETVEREPLSMDQLIKLLNEMTCFRDRLMTRVGVELGPRNVDLCSMTVDDVKFEEQEVELSNTKNRGTYTLPVTDELALLLRRWVDTGRSVRPHSENHDYLFASNQGGHISPTAFVNIVRKAAKRAGIQKTLKKVPLTDRQKEMLNTEKDYRRMYAVTPHTLRHTFAELLDDAGLSLEQRSEALDHTGTAVTKDHYSSGDSGHTEMMKNQFSGVDRGSE